GRQVRAAFSGQSVTAYHVTGLAAMAAMAAMEMLICLQRGVNRFLTELRRYCVQANHPKYKGAGDADTYPSAGNGGGPGRVGYALPRVPRFSRTRPASVATSARPRQRHRRA